MHIQNNAFSSQWSRAFLIPSVIISILIVIDIIFEEALDHVILGMFIST